MEIIQIWCQIQRIQRNSLLLAKRHIFHQTNFTMLLHTNGFSGDHKSESPTTGHIFIHERITNIHRKEIVKWHLERKPYVLHIIGTLCRRMNIPMCNECRKDLYHHRLLSSTLRQFAIRNKREERNKNAHTRAPHTNKR